MLDYIPSVGDRLLCIGQTEGTNLEVGRVYTVEVYYPNLVGFQAVRLSAGIVVYRPSRFTRYTNHIYRR